MEHRQLTVQQQLTHVLDVHSTISVVLSLYLPNYSMPKPPIKS